MGAGLEALISTREIGRLKNGTVKDLIREKITVHGVRYPENLESMTGILKSNSRNPSALSRA